MKLFGLLKEQCGFGFTGKVNILLKESSQYLGSVYIQDGLICLCEYKGKSSKRALIDALIDDFRNQSLYNFIIEPEIIPESKQIFMYEIEELKIEFKKIVDAMKKMANLRPDDNLRLLVNSEFIIGKEEVTNIEFDVLSVITDFSKVSEIYCNLDYCDFEITEALVNLRKKKALKVVTA